MQKGWTDEQFNSEGPSGIRIPNKEINKYVDFEVRRPDQESKSVKTDKTNLAGSSIVVPTKLKKPVIV